jgi:hypothetical protein
MPLASLFVLDSDLAGEHGNSFQFPVPSFKCENSFKFQVSGFKPENLQQISLSEHEQAACDKSAFLPNRQLLVHP